MRATSLLLLFILAAACSLCVASDACENPKAPRIGVTTDSFAHIGQPQIQNS